MNKSAKEMFEELGFEYKKSDFSITYYKELLEILAGEDKEVSE